MRRSSGTTKSNKASFSYLTVINPIWRPLFVNLHQRHQNLGPVQGTKWRRYGHYQFECTHQWCRDWRRLWRQQVHWLGPRSWFGLVEAVHAPIDVLLEQLGQGHPRPGHQVRRLRRNKGFNLIYRLNYNYICITPNTCHIKHQIIKCQLTSNWSTQLKN